jgi:hypothetical protein
MSDKIEIKNRFTHEVIYDADLPESIAQLPRSQQVRWAIAEAVKNDANLSDADLSGAYLSDAYLSDADLSGAYLRGADLSDADLSGAYLRGADLSDADLSGADLRDAYLRGADLRGADLSDADLSGADLRDAYLSDADLRDAYLSDAIGAPASLSDATAESAEQRLAREAQRAARFRKRFADVPVIPFIDAKILAAVEANPTQFDMSTWHSVEACETTHCRAGWAVHLAGEAGYALEAKYDAAYAGRLIYLVSAGYLPDFFCDNKTALADIKARAAEQAQP